MNAVASVTLFMIGVGVVAATLYSAIVTFVLPRSVNTLLTRLVFVTVGSIFRWRARRARTYEARDSIMALYAPVALLALPPVWLSLVLLSYGAMYLALGIPTWQEAIKFSGSSLFTLGFDVVPDISSQILAFTEAGIGLILLTLLISYLPTIYSAFSRREAAVTLLEVRAGSPPTAWEMIERYHRIHGLSQLHQIWTEWEIWFADVDETHTSLAELAFFRSPNAHRSWITAAGAVLDAASLVRAAVDIPTDPHADLCIRAGFLALRHIADFFRIHYKAEPTWMDPISISREEFDGVCRELAGRGVPMKADTDQAWQDFAGWRVNYDTPLLALAALVQAPAAPWSSDRSPIHPGHDYPGRG